MPYHELLLEDVPACSTETAVHLLDILYALTDALENRYYAQIRQASQVCSLQYDLFKPNPEPLDFDDPLPPF